MHPQDTSEPARCVDYKTIEKAELEQIEERRKKAFKVCKGRWNRNKPDLVGLALSGGGIRSAMFNLGILRALRRSELLRYVDYMSTVSGGGYIGGLLTAQVWKMYGPDRKPNDQRQSTDGNVAAEPRRRAANAEAEPHGDSRSVASSENRAATGGQSRNNGVKRPINAHDCTIPLLDEDRIHIADNCETNQEPPHPAVPPRFDFLAEPFEFYYRYTFGLILSAAPLILFACVVALSIAWVYRGFDNVPAEKLLETEFKGLNLAPEDSLDLKEHLKGRYQETGDSYWPWFSENWRYYSYYDFARALAPFVLLCAIFTLILAVVFVSTIVAERPEPDRWSRVERAGGRWANGMGKFALLAFVCSLVVVLTNFDTVVSDNAVLTFGQKKSQGRASPSNTTSWLVTCGAVVQAVLSVAAFLLSQRFVSYGTSSVHPFGKVFKLLSTAVVILPLLLLLAFYAREDFSGMKAKVIQADELLTEYGLWVEHLARDTDADEFERRSIAGTSALIAEEVAEIHEQPRGRTSNIFWEIRGLVRKFDQIEKSIKENNQIDKSIKENNQIDKSIKENKRLERIILGETGPSNEAITEARVRKLRSEAKVALARLISKFFEYNDVASSHTMETPWWRSVGRSFTFKWGPTDDGADNSAKSIVLKRYRCSGRAAEKWVDEDEKRDSSDEEWIGLFRYHIPTAPDHFKTWLGEKPWLPSESKDATADWYYLRIAAAFPIIIHATTTAPIIAVAAEAIAANAVATDPTPAPLFGVPSPLREDPLRCRYLVNFDQAARRFWLKWLGLGLVLTGLGINFNKTSLHRFYRDRLRDSFLRGERPGDGLDGRVSQLKAVECGFPYQIISCTLNVPPRHDERTPDRNFIFSQEYSGSRATGFRRTEEYREDQTRFSDALAISGAAFTPFQADTLPARLVMLFLNIRLGQWYRNPHHVRGRAGYQFLGFVFRPCLLVMLWLVTWYERIVGPSSRSKPTANGKEGWCRNPLVFLSDGAHYDNLGLELLLERRCKLIIVSDVSNDDQFQLADFLSVLQRAREDGIRFYHERQRRNDKGEEEWVPLERWLRRWVDLAIQDQVKGRDDSEDAKRRRRRHAINEPMLIGRICYKEDYKDKDKKEPNPSGWLIIFKPSYAEIESMHVSLFNYFRSSETFPHDPGFDQFFTKEQADAYQMLGEHIGSMLKFKEKPNTEKRQSIEEIMKLRDD